MTVLRRERTIPYHSTEIADPIFDGGLVGHVPVLAWDRDAEYFSRDSLHTFHISNRTPSQ